MYRYLRMTSVILIIAIALFAGSTSAAIMKKTAADDQPVSVAITEKAAVIADNSKSTDAEKKATVNEILSVKKTAIVDPSPPSKVKKAVADVERPARIKAVKSTHIADPPCGALGETCCGGNICNAALRCASNKCYSICSLGGTNCSCGYNSVACSSTNYCDTSSQLCLPACQLGVMTGSCMCMPQNGSAPHVLWWGVCGTPACGGLNQSCCSGNTCNSGLGCVAGKCTPKCTLGQNNCVCGYTPTPCNATTYCDTSSQFCLPMCQYGVTTGSCMCMPQNGGAPHVLWWGICGNTTVCGGLNQSCCSGNLCNSNLTCQSGICNVPPVQCGGTNQPCCAGNTCTASAHYCDVTGTHTCKPLPSPITVYTESTPGGAGRTYPIVAEKAYGTQIYVEAMPVPGYDFANWSGNCPIGNIYERVTSSTVAPTQTYFCRLIANFVAGTTCGASWKPCCASNACNSGLACNINGTCVPSSGTLAPDLVVIETDIPHQFGVGILTFGTARITNIGNAYAQNSTISYYVDNVLAGSASVSSLQTGGVTVQLSATCPSVGPHIFKVSADSGNVVAESNEANNDMETAFNCV